MALSRPVVASNVGGIPEMIEDGVTGLLVRRTTPDALAAAIVRLLTDHPLADTLARAGHDLVHDRFCIELMVRAIEEIYDEGARARPPPEGRRGLSATPAAAPSARQRSTTITAAEATNPSTAATARPGLSHPMPLTRSVISRPPPRKAKNTDHTVAYSDRRGGGSRSPAAAGIGGGVGSWDRGTSEDVRRDAEDANEYGEHADDRDDDRGGVRQRHGNDVRVAGMKDAPRTPASRIAAASSRDASTSR